jgi:hypothetical protein
MTAMALQVAVIGDYQDAIRAFLDGRPIRLLET